MNDRELLELAAKAAGLGEVWYLEGSDTPYVGPRYTGGAVEYRVWKPLEDDGDALRLAVKLRLLLDTEYNDGVGAGGNSLEEIWEPHETNPYAATRRAIVRAAAEIGRSM